MLRSHFSRLKSVTSYLAAILASSCLACALYAADPIAPPNYDEEKVPQFTLPDPLVAPDGSKIETPKSPRNLTRSMEKRRGKKFGSTSTTLRKRLRRIS